jgi:methyl-accepting chemotaxis protein
MNTLETSSKTLSIKKKLLGVSVFLLMGMVLFMYFAYQTFATSLENERKNQTKNLSSSAMGIIHRFYQLELAGELNAADAQKHAMLALESATYGDTGYFWINSGNGKLLMQPYTADRVGINQINWTDINGKYIFREFVDKAKSGGGWVSYHWPKPASKDEYPKISYVDYFEHWDWVLGTGVYLDDMHKSIFWLVAKASGVLFVVFLIFVSGGIALINVFANQLEMFAIKDALTNLYTKRFLYEIIPDIQRKSLRFQEQSLAVIFIDIDYFKKVNDSYGHSIGDEVLQCLGEIVSEETRADDYCIRYGGEEIVVVGFYEDLMAAIRTADRIRLCFGKRTFIHNQTSFSVSLSAGVAIYDGRKETFEDTLKRADEKLYESKALGRNCVTS